MPSNAYETHSLVIYLYRYGVFDNVRMEVGDGVRYGYGNYVFLFAAIIAIVSGIVISIRNRDKDWSIRSDKIHLRYY